MKTLVLESPFNKVTGLQSCNFIKETPTKVLYKAVNIAKF